MDEVEGELKHAFGEEVEDLRCLENNFVPLPHIIGQREIGHKLHNSTTQYLERWGEDSFVQRPHTHLACQIPTTSKTTYLLAFSPDGTKVASSHGDHNIYVTDMKTGKSICTLKGHPRSPWCIAFHPSSNEIIASGCLGGQVRVWDLKGGSEIWSPRKHSDQSDSVIASLAFHPTDQVLVIATDNNLFFWDWFCPKPFAKISTASKFEKVKFVDFDPLGYKLITGIVIVRPERNRVDGNSGVNSSNSNNNNTSNHNNNNIDSNNATPPEYPTRNSLSLNSRSLSHRFYRYMDRSFRNSHNHSSFTTEGTNQAEAPSTLLSHSQRWALNRARDFAQSVNESVDRNGNQDLGGGSGTVPGPSSLSDFHLPEDPPSPIRLRYLGHPPSGGQANPPATAVAAAAAATSTPSEDEARLGEFRPHLRPISDDSASSSSVDSSSSATSGASGASHERNTRLSLLWTSRLHRDGGGESPPGGVYDLEERRGEGSVMRAGGARGEPPPPPPPQGREERDVTPPITAHESDGDRPRHTGRILAGGLGRLGPRASVGRHSPVGRHSMDTRERGPDRDEEDSDGDLTQRGWRHSGQGGRWMYYRGKYPGSGSWRGGGGGAGGSSRLPVPRSERGRTPPSRNPTPASRNPTPASRNPIPPSRTPTSRTPTSRTPTSRTPTSRRQQHQRVDEDSLAIPGPSGLSRNSGSAPPETFLPMRSPAGWSGRQSQSFLDPHFGVQLLSRHIENIQNICRSLSIPRAQLELSRHRNEISQLQQIRSMLYDIQHQIRSLRASVDQTISEEFPGADDTSLNSASINPEPLASELLHSGERGLTDEVELEVNIGTEDMEHYSYSTLAEEDSEQVAPDLLTNSLDVPHLSSHNVPSLDPTPENEQSSRASSSSLRMANKAARNTSRLLRTLARASASSLRLSNKSSRNSSRPLRTLAATRVRHRRNLRRLVREARWERRRAALHNRRVESRAAAASSRSTAPEDGPSSSLGYNPPQETEPFAHVRRRHSGDWQRRLRSVLACQQQQERAARAREEAGPSTEQGLFPCFNASSGSGNSSSGAPSSSGVASMSRGNEQTTLTNPTVAEPSLPLPSSSSASSHAAPAPTTTSSSMPNPPASVPTTASSSTHLEQGLPNGLSRSDDEEAVNINEQPERVTRTGPPTTSLSARIATMLATQREESRNRLSDIYSDALGAPSPLSPSRSRLRASGISRLRYDYELHRRLGRSYLRGVPVPLSRGQASRSSSSLEDLPDPLSNSRNGRNEFPSRPVYQSLRNLRREMMMSHRNRMLRRSSGTLVSGGDLAEATLAAIDPTTAADHERQRDNFRSEWRETYRHMLQLMADRMNQMLNQSLSGGLNPSAEETRGPFDPEDEEGEVMEHLNLRPYQQYLRRMSNLRHSSSRFQGSSSFSNEGFQPPPASTSSLDRHMRNLRLLVRLALHLIYQLLNFICNQNLESETGGQQQQQQQQPQQQPLPRGATPSAGLQSGSSDASVSFEMEIEPGLHNLTELLETVRMASEELRQDAAAAATDQDAPSATPLRQSQRPGVGHRPGRNSSIYGGRSSIVIEAPLDPPNESNWARPIARIDGRSVYSSSQLRRRLNDFLIRTGNYSQRTASAQQPSDWGPSTARESGFGELDRERVPLIQRPLPTTPSVPRDPHVPLPIPQIVLSDMSQDGPSGSEAPPAEAANRPVTPPEDMGFHLRTFGGIPLRFLGRQNAVDRRSSPDSEDSSGAENNNGREGDNNERSFSWYPPSSGARPPFRYWNNGPHNPGSGQFTVLHPPSYYERNHERDPDHYPYFSQPYFSHYIAASRNIAGSLFDPYSPVMYNGQNQFYRIQAWDFQNYGIPDISDSYSNIVVSKCRIHFDASVSISVDGTLLAAVLPDSVSLTRIGVYSLETKTLGQLLFSSNIGFNIVCVSFSPTMRHLVVGISSHRLGVHHSEKHVIGRIYKLCHSPASYRGGYPGSLKFCRSIELQSELRQSSLNCIRWVPIPGQGLVYGTNRGQLTIIR